MSNFLCAVAIPREDGQADVYDFLDNTLRHESTCVPLSEVLGAVPGQAMLIDGIEAQLVIRPGGAPEQLLDDVGRAWLFARRVEEVAAEAAMVAIRHAHDDGMTPREIAIFLRCDLATVEMALL